MSANYECCKCAWVGTDKQKVKQVLPEDRTDDGYAQPQTLTCPKCGGSDFYKVTVCLTCDGEGYLHGLVEDETCSDCEGTGTR